MSSDSEFEEARRAALQKINILDTFEESAYDDITYLLTCVTETPLAAISILDDDRLWLKSVVGAAFRQIPRDEALGTQVILHPDAPLVITDAMNDPRYATHSYVTGPMQIRSYYGVALRTPEGLPIGAVSVADIVPREFDDRQKNAIERLAHLCTTQIELRRESLCLREVAAFMHKQKMEHLHDDVIVY